MKLFLITCIAAQSLAPSNLLAAAQHNPAPRAAAPVAFAPEHAVVRAENTGDWKLWQAYKRGFLEESGRIVDHDDGARTTSEAQSYGLFFALVANDRSAFDRILQWTQSNLASGDLSTNLPAWLWGCDSQGQWRVLDSNSATDSDLWIAYTLLQAGRLWQEPGFTKLGTDIAANIAAHSVIRVPTLGLVLLPAPTGFQSHDAVELNPSYQPLQLLYGLATELPEGPWLKLAESTPALLHHASPHGFVLDWVRYSAKDGWQPGHGPASEPRASFDAIRVYLWAGMAHPQTRGRKDLLASLQGMRRYMKNHFYPPMIVSAAGKITDERAGVGYSAALLPFLDAVGEQDALILQRNRLNIARKTQSGLFGDPPRYYDQNLALFGTGWMDHLFRFTSEGALEVRWRSK